MSQVLKVCFSLYISGAAASSEEMPLQFRSVVPYTLPGVLALIGWWWYILRKKERLTSHDTQEGAPATAGLITSPSEGSNGLVEKSAVCPTNDTGIPTNRPSKDTNQRTDNENSSHICVQDTEAESSLEQSSVDPNTDPGRVRQVPKPLVASADKEDGQHVPFVEQEQCLPLVLVTELEKLLVTESASAPGPPLEQVSLPCRSAKDMCPTEAHLFHAERPEPEGEVARHHSSNNTPDEVIVPSVTPSKAQSVIPSEADYLETCHSAQDSHQHILNCTSSTPAQTSTPLTIVQNCITAFGTQEDIQITSNKAEEQDLEFLAAGLISEVISAATQEVLGVTSCQPCCSNSAPLAGSRLFFQQEPIALAQQHPDVIKSSSPVSYESIETTQKELQGMLNGCSSNLVCEPAEVSHRAHQTDSIPKGLWPTSPHQAAQSTPLLSVVVKSDKVAVLGEDSACSTCHSEEGISSEDILGSMFDNQMDLVQVTDLTAAEPAHPQSLGEVTTEATEENSVDSLCEMKRFNGIDLRNEAHGTCEVETDHSGGKGAVFFLRIQFIVKAETGRPLWTVDIVEKAFPLLVVPYRIPHTTLLPSPQQKNPIQRSCFSGPKMVGCF